MQLSSKSTFLLFINYINECLKVLSMSMFIIFGILVRLSKYINFLLKNVSGVSLFSVKLYTTLHLTLDLTQALLHTSAFIPAVGCKTNPVLATTPELLTPNQKCSWHKTLKGGSIAL